jgi:hypothetical protein
MEKVRNAVVTFIYTSFETCPAPKKHDVTGILIAILKNSKYMLK